jgi:hypothetical protein
MFRPDRDRFSGDDGSVAYARAAGIYIDGVEAPACPEHVVPAPTGSPAVPALTLLAFGQSNAANTGEGRYHAGDHARVFNVFDMNFHAAADPLPGASNDGGSVWGRLADMLVQTGHYRSVLIVPIAVGGTFVKDWAPGGALHRRLRFALHRLRMAGLRADVLCWHQGEAEANLTAVTADEYRTSFLAMLSGIRAHGSHAAVYVAVATLCATAEHPFRNREEIRRAQQRLPSLRRGILAGPDTDAIGIEYRLDGCHFSAEGLDRHAEAWFRALTRRSAPDRVSLAGRSVARLLEGWPRIPPTTPRGSRGRMALRKEGRPQ